MKRNIGLYLSALLTSAVLSTAAFAEINQEKSQIIEKTTDEAVLISVFTEEGDGPDEFFYKMLAGRRLAVLGTEAALPTLTALLPDEKLSFCARYALENMPFDSVDAAFAQAALELEGKPLVGVIDSMGVRAKAESVPTLKAVLEKTTDVSVKKAVYASLGMIATPEAADLLQAEVANLPAIESDTYSDSHLLCAGLGDALLDCATAWEAQGKLAEAIVLYDVVLNPAFPLFNQKAGAYHGLLARKADCVETLVSRLSSDTCRCIPSCLKTIREFDDASAEPIVKALIELYPNVPEAEQVLIIRALGDRKDETSKQLTYPVLIDLLSQGSDALKIAAIQAGKNAGQVDIASYLSAVMSALISFSDETRSSVQEDVIKTVIALPADQVKEFLVQQNLANAAQASSVCDVQIACLGLRIVELNRYADMAQDLVSIADASGVKPEIRDAALAALSEIITLDSLNLLVEALNGETDDQKVDWILRAACTRLPREDCAAKVADMFHSAAPADKEKMMLLLKQIGGQTALQCVVDACWKKDTMDSATKVLGTWNTPDDINAVADACLKIAQEMKDNRFRSRGIKGYIRVARQFDNPVPHRLNMCQVAFDTAVQTEEKALIFEVFKRIVEVASVNAALSYADDPDFNANACDAAIVVAEKIQGTSPELQNAMKTLIEKTSDSAIKDRAQKVLERK